MLRNTWQAVAALIDSCPGPAQVPSSTTGRATARSVAGRSFSYVQRPDLRAYGRAATCGTHSPAPARVPGHLRRRLRAAPTSWPRRCLHGRPASPSSRRRSSASAARAWIENAAGAVGRCSPGGQVARDRFDAATCVGTSAVYRRAALEPQGGPTSSLRRGRAPGRRAPSRLVRRLPAHRVVGKQRFNDLDAFVRQRYRWHRERRIVFSRRLGIPMSIPAHSPISVLLRLHRPALRAAAPIIMLAFLPGQVRLRNHHPR
jgi:hypothetical protein